MTGRVSSPNIDAELRQTIRESMPQATDEQIDALMAEAKERGRALRSSVFPHGIPPCSYCGEATLHICPDATR